MMHNQYLDLKDLSKRIGLSPRTIRAWVNDPTDPLPAYRVRVRGKLLFRWCEVEAFVQAHRLRSIDIDDVATELLKVLNKPCQHHRGPRNNV